MEKMMLYRLNRARYARAGVLLTLLLAVSAGVSAEPVRLTCTPDKSGQAIARVWTYDAQAHTVDGHHIGEQVTLPNGAYNRYFMTDSAIGFSASSGVRHSISLIDGRYTAYGSNGQVIWTGTCTAPAQ